MPLPPYYLEVILVSGMASFDAMMMNGRGGLQVLFVSFTKGPGGFPYVFIIAAQVTTLVPIDGTTLVDHRVFVLGGDQKVFDGSATLEVSLDAIPTTDLFDTFTKTLCVGNDNVTLTWHTLVGRLGIVVAPIIDLSGRQYLQWDSHHNLSAKFSVIQTLSHRASTVCSNPELLQKEKEHIRKALTKCNYPSWALDKVEKRLNRSSGQVNDGGNNSAQSANQGVPSTGHIVIPYTQGLCESIKKICGRYGIQTHFKGGRTIKNLLVSPKDKDPMVNQCGAIYWYQCGDLGCNDEYIGETSRTFGERYKEHLKAPSAIHHHSIKTGHTTNQNNFQIIGREGQNLARNIKESIYIRVNNPSLNNSIGKFNLSHIWDKVLLNTKGLTLK